MVLGGVTTSVIDRPRRDAVKDRATLLRKVLMFDAVTCAGMGLGLVLAGSHVDDLLGLPVPLLRGAGAVLLPFAALLAVAARPARPADAAVRGVVAANATWAAASALLLTSGQVAPTTIGTVFVLGQAAAVATIAAVEAFCLRRSQTVHA